MICMLGSLGTPSTLCKNNFVILSIGFFKCFVLILLYKIKLLILHKKTKVIEPSNRLSNAAVINWDF